jgi:peptidyl-dipeptidase A
LLAVELTTRAEHRFRPLFLAANHAAWAVNVEATEANEARRVEAEVALSDALADPELFAEVAAARAAAPAGNEGRQLELLYNAMVGSQVRSELRHRLVALEASVEARFALHRGVVRGVELNDNEIIEVLKTSNDVGERREAWEAAKTVGAAVADDVRELARMRNEIARTLGYRDWFAFGLSAQEMDEDKLFETLASCETETASAFARWKQTLDARLAERFACEPQNLRPWHYADPFFQDVPTEGGVELDSLLAERDVVALAGETFSGFGLDTGKVLARSDLYARDAKCQHAFCIDIDREGDVRVLANARNDLNWADTMLHELGHAAYDLGIDSGLPWLLRTCHLTVTEGIAIMMGSLAKSPEWLHEVAGLDGIDADELRAARAAEGLLFTRWVLVMTNFERELYADPDGDLDTRWWDLVERYQLLTRPDGRKAPDWASKIHIASAPVYYHTYLYGHLVAAQLRATLEATAGGLVGRPAAGAFLTERVFRPGESLRWDRLIEQATGEPLAVRHYAAELDG